MYLVIDFFPPDFKEIRDFREQKTAIALNVLNLQEKVCLILKIDINRRQKSKSMSLLWKCIKHKIFKFCDEHQIFWVYNFM